MANNGKILKKDIVEDKVFDIGKDIATSLQPAINATEEWNKDLEVLKTTLLSLGKSGDKLKTITTPKELSKNV